MHTSFVASFIISLISCVYNLQVAKRRREPGEMVSVDSSRAESERQKLKSQKFEPAKAKVLNTIFT